MGGFERFQGAAEPQLIEPLTMVPHVIRAEGDTVTIAGSDSPGASALVHIAEVAAAVDAGSEPVA